MCKHRPTCTKRFATDEEAKAAAERVMQKHAESLKRLGKKAPDFDTNRDPGDETDVK